MTPQQIDVRFVAGHFVRVIEPGEAECSHDLRRRGLRIDYDPTCWPRSTLSRWLMTTGGGELHHPNSAAQRQRAAYMKLLAAIFLPEEQGHGFDPVKNVQDKAAQEMLTRWRDEYRQKKAREIEATRRWAS